MDQVLDTFNATLQSAMLSNGEPPCFNRPSRQTVLKSNHSSDLFLTGSIVGIIGDAYDYEDLIVALMTANIDTTIRIILDTPGGRIDTAAMIANAIKNSAGRVIGVAHGQVMSSGSTLVFAACSSYEIRPGAIFMFHGSSHAQQGKSLAIRDYAVAHIDYITACLDRAVELGMLLPEEKVQIIEKQSTIYLPGNIVMTRMKAKGLNVL